MLAIPIGVTLKLIWTAFLHYKLITKKIALLNEMVLQLENDKKNLTQAHEQEVACIKTQELTFNQQITITNSGIFSRDREIARLKEINDDHSRRMSRIWSLKSDLLNVNNEIRSIAINPGHKVDICRQNSAYHADCKICKMIPLCNTIENKVNKITD